MTIRAGFDRLRGWHSKFREFAGTKRGVTVLTVIGALLLLLSFRSPYWNLTLVAPQYPQGLKLSIYMDHVEGDVSEVNILNHYIGMGHLDEAAQFEREYAWYGLLVLALGAMLVIPVGRKVYGVFYAPPFLFLGGFLGDLFYWLYRAGHQLNPDAPVHVKAFTPVLLGSGKIGQFHTFAAFGTGFWIAVAGSALLFYAIAGKKKVCAGCADYKSCSAVCDRPGSWLGRGGADRA